MNQFKTTLPRPPMRCALLFLATLGISILTASAKPNIVLIFADDLGWKDVGYQGAGFFETPRIDALAKDGMVFTDGYAAAGNCAPSRACLLSGTYTPRHHVFAVGTTNRGPKDKMRLVPVPNRSGLSSDNVTLADALKAAGYATGIFGKWHLDGPDGASPAQQGFDMVFDSRGKNPNAGRGANNDPKGMFSITRAACDFIEQNKERPFFAYIAHHAIHSGLEARPATLERFKAKAAGDKHKDALYAACTHDLDTVTGQLLDKLDELGLRDNTLIVFTSDNGATKDSPQEPLRGNKGCYYEGGIREPFIIRWPGVTRPGSSSSVPVINVDLYPTFLAAAGAPAPKVLDGEDLMPLLRGDGSLKRGAVFWHFPGYLDQPVLRGRDPVFRTRPVSVIRKGDWKLHLYHEEWLLDGGREKIPGNKAVELYQMRDDIGERHDLSAENPEKRDELLGDLLAWMESVDAPLPARPQAGGPTDAQPKRDRKGGKP